MGSVGFGEIALIALVALLVFGPDRLPELSRKAGELLTKAREATRSFTDALDNEVGDDTSSIRSLQAEFQATKDELTSAAGTVLNFDKATDPDAAPDEPTDETPLPSEKAGTIPVEGKSATADGATPPASDHTPAPTTNDEAAE
jgi:sec-independent protein translocase protein TatB